MGNKAAIKKLDTLIELIENKSGEWSKIVLDAYKEPMLDALKHIKKNIGTDYIDMDEI